MSRPGHKVLLCNIVVPLAIRLTFALGLHGLGALCLPHPDQLLGFVDTNIYGVLYSVQTRFKEKIDGIQSSITGIQEGHYFSHGPADPFKRLPFSHPRTDHLYCLFQVEGAVLRPGPRLRATSFPLGGCRITNNGSTDCTSNDRYKRNAQQKRSSSGKECQNRG